MLLTEILQSEDFHVLWLDTCEYTSGVWYDKMKRESRCKLKDMKVLQNNYLTGNAAKIARAKAWRHWYVDEAAGKCTRVFLGGHVLHE